MNFKKYEEFLKENNDQFDTKIVDKIKDFAEGDEVFHSGQWKTVDKIDADSILLYHPSSGKTRISSVALKRLPVLVKVY